MIHDFRDETKEQSLERILTDLTKEDGCGFTEVTYIKGRPDHRVFNVNRALDEEAFLSFISNSQSNAYTSISLRAGDSANERILEGFNQQVKVRGLISVLKNGFEVLGTKLRPMYFKPEDETDAEAMARYEEDRFFCARQFHYSKDSKRKSIDIVLLINGIPLVAIELKNNFSGQDTGDAVEQFCRDRDQSELFFKLNQRCLVMFAIDNYFVEMATKLDGVNTVFIPFNQGSNGSGRSGRAGNPIPEDNVPTHYMFDNILAKDNLQRIIGDFLVYDDDDQKPRVLFPRYHQLDCVQTMVELAKAEGPGHSYLIQHSAGSGKSNTIAWLAFRLLNLQVYGRSVFNSVIICVHRTVLNSQLNDTVSLFQYMPGMVALVNNSAELREALINGNKVIVSTIQKFGMINESLKPFDRNFAIIFDEAHTSTTGRLNKKTKVALGVRELTEKDHKILEQEFDSEEEILKAYEKIRYEGRQDNLSFYAFTATPKNKTLRAFGKRMPDGSYVAHHYYSMMQAIDEGFICDVLKDYHTYTGYYDLMKDMANSDDPMVDSKKAMAILRKLEARNDLIIKQKARVIVDYFQDNVEHDLAGNAKAMLVVDGRETVLQYRDAILEVCKEQGYDGIHMMVAFSGSLDHNGETVTEESFNFMPDGRRVKSDDMAEVFDGPYFNLMIAADKFQVGFDQPKLTTMFVDKYLRDVEAVQTLSRLNRVIPGVQKSTHVLDFRNTAEDIFNAFAPYYEETETEEGFDPTYVYVKRSELDRFGIINEEEVRRFAHEFKATDPDALKRICGLLEPARQRFLTLRDESEEEADKFRRLARCLERQYGAVTITTNFMDPYFHSLVDYLHFLLKVLPKKRSDPLPNIEDLVSVDHYRLVSTGNQAIQLSAGEALPNPRGTLSANNTHTDLLSSLVKQINDRWSLPDFNDDDKLALLKSASKQVREKIREKGSDLHEYSDWTQESFEKQFKGVTMSAIAGTLIGNKEFADALLNDPDMIDKVASSILADIRLHPDEE